jgi:TolB-like protein/tetratricopeptide (TPR) repeat protein
MERVFRYIRQFIRELRRRQILRTMAVYAGTSFVILQVTAILTPAFQLPSWTVRMVVVLLLLGFPVAVALAWTYNVTDEGVARVGAEPESDNGKDETTVVDQSILISNVVVVGLLLIGAGLVLYPRFFPVDNATSQAKESASTSTEESMEKTQPMDRSIAVLPFEALGRKEPGTFADGIHDGLLVRLSNVSSLKVISRTTVQKFRNTALELPAIADSLRVKWVVEGGVQRVNDQVRVNVQLIDPRTDTHAWAQDYQRDLSAKNLFAIQSEITKKVAQALRVQLSPEESERVERRPTNDLTAYQYYVRGRRKLDTRRPEAMRKSLDFFRRALQRDSSYALAWSGLADAVTLSDLYGYRVPASAPSSRSAARRALALDSTLAEAHASLGLVTIVNRLSPLTALPDLRRAVALRPSYAQAQHWLGELLLLVGQPAQAHKHAALAVQLNPANADARRVLIDVQLAEEEAETALENVRQAQRRHPNYSGSASYMGWSYREFVALAHLKRYDEAVQVAQEAAAAATGRTAERWRVYQALVRAQTGTTSLAQKQIQRLRSDANVPFTAFHVGLLQAGLGKKKAAFRAFDQVDQWVDGYKMETIQYHYPAILGPLRKDPRYDALLRTVNDAWNLRPDGSLPEEFVGISDG